VQYGPPGNCTAQSVTSSTLGSPITVNGVREYQNSVAVSPATAYCYRAIINLYLSQTGKLALRNNAGSVTTTSATAVPTGGWHKVVLHVIVNGAASSVDVSLDGATVADLALSGQNFGANPITSLQLGETTTGRTYDIAFDDVTVTQTPP
jgi:hypothetical protein